MTHEISTPSGNKIFISEDEKLISIIDQNQNKIVMNDSGINIESATDITIKAINSIKMEAVNIETNASGINKVKGSMVQIN
jgi:hypothetical protein